MSKNVTLAGQILHGRDRLGAWQVKDVDGWFKTPPTKGESGERPGADGEFDLPVQYGARSLVITGRVLCRSAQDAAAARARVLGLLGSPGRLQVTDASGTTLWADIKRNGQILTDLTGTMVRFTIEAKAVDPRKFGNLATFNFASGSPAQVYHWGNYQARPVIQVNGPLTGGATITHPGGQYTFLGDLIAGGWVRVDMNTGRLRLNGNDRSDLITRADLYAVQPGAKAQFSISNGAGYVEIIDTFI